MNPLPDPKVISASRVLISIPIVHSEADMGALNQSIQRMKLKKLGKSMWEQSLALVNDFWTQIEQTTEDLALAYEKVRLYQDGLPVCGHEWEIVADLAKAGSRNYQLLLKLKGKGATLMGTESTDLLLEEYQLAKQVFAGEMSRRPSGQAAPAKNLQHSLLQRRDQFIARRINQTLLSGETGLLFIGMLHRVEPWLAPDIRVLHPIRRALKGGEQAP